MKLYCIGIGPGRRGADDTRAQCVLWKKCDCVAGYGLYLDLIENLISGKEPHRSGMTREVLRCKAAVEAAKQGKNGRGRVLGDAGVYGMAGLLLELCEHEPNLEVEVIPGITAACSGGAVLGSPLTCDFALHQPVRPAHAVGQDRAASARRGGWPISASRCTIRRAKNAPTICAVPAIFCWRLYRRRLSAVWCAALAEKAKAARLQRSVSCVIHRSIC